MVNSHKIIKYKTILCYIETPHALKLPPAAFAFKMISARLDTSLKIENSEQEKPFNESDFSDRVGH